MACKKCGSLDFTTNSFSEVQQRGCLTVILYLILLCIPILGWIVLFSLLRGRKSKIKTIRVCNRCGHKWEVK